MDYIELLNEDEALFKVSNFELLRGDSRLLIEVSKLIASKLDEQVFTYFAYPVLLNPTKNTDCYGRGDNEEEALADCLKRIKGLKPSDMFDLPVD